MTDAEMLACATTFTLKHADRHTPSEHIRELKVEMRSKDPDSWAIIGDGHCLNHDGDLEWEPMPSSRDDDFLTRCRWPTAHQAIAAAQAHMQQYPTGYKPANT